MKIVGTPDGGADCVVLDWASGSFIPDRSYFSRTLPGDFKDVDALTPEQLDRVVARHRIEILTRYARTLAAASPDAGDVFRLLGLDRSIAPFDADDAEATAGPGLMILAPRLVHRGALDAALGPPRVDAGPGGTVAAVYRVSSGTEAPGRCTVLAVFPTDALSEEAMLVQLARAGR